MPRILPALVALCAALALACGGDDDSDGVATSTPGMATPTAAATATAETTIAETKPTEPPTPEPNEVSVANEPVSVEASDGTVLEGHLYSPAGPKRQALIIVAPVDQSVWAESTRAFTGEGIAVFTFDPRGLGETAGEPAPDTLSADTQFITRFVMSREYPLVYLLGVGEQGGAAATDAAANLEELTGLVTYGITAGSAGEQELVLAPDAAWSGEDVLAEPEVRQAILDFVLDN